MARSTWCPRPSDHEAPGGLYAYRQDPATQCAPLALISPATGRAISSTFGQVHRRQVPVELHPDDDDARGLAGGVHRRSRPAPPVSVGAIAPDLPTVGLEQGLEALYAQGSNSWEIAFLHNLKVPILGHECVRVSCYRTVHEFVVVWIRSDQIPAIGRMYLPNVGLGREEL